MNSSQQHPYLANVDLLIEYAKLKNFRELLIPVMGGLFLNVLRQFLETYIFKPAATYWGLKEVKYREAPPNPVLEMAYSINKKWNAKQILSLSKQVDKTEEEIRDWLEMRISQDKPTVLKKFCESAWKVCYYILHFFAGFFLFQNKLRTLDIDDYWKDTFTLNVISSGVWWYFILFFSFVWSQMSTLNTDVKRKDFYVMLVHHVAVLVLLTWFWFINAVRVAALAVWLIDSCNLILEGSKMSNYLGYRKYLSFPFILFTLVWFITRFGTHLWIQLSFLEALPQCRNTWLGFYFYYFSLTLQVILLILDFVWTYFLARSAMNFLIGRTVQDYRSDSDNDNDK